MQMKSAIGAGALLLLLGMIVPAYAQHDQEQKQQGKPQQQERKPEKPAAAPHQAPAHQARLRTRLRRPEQAPAAPIMAVSAPPNPRMAGCTRAAFRNMQGRCAAVLCSLAPLRGAPNTALGSSAAAITATGFRMTATGVYFGADHFFRISRLPLVFVGGYPRFQYDGYWVTFVDPWPDTWPANWYETDDCYVEYTGDGYYVYDRARPGIGIAVTIAF